eukprot:CAMPEP_0177529194 /NCGR_PEP_ID=MMETSP0369-20130122/52661_1 /TAXON_ID=447022 ORGANISM="Scrippsiella hangoei-like, Strain SHHI-4" /NCGR_SAMPLE_ID=MMETSP0369 /ASSEMBLY_ACC=CAM_ASM_000364 /LENGTH=112 /DNA_ID=CAMNT_0019009817 /DNA_START=29 /DNA_END=367 /DNA_ORIENTATION=-
MFASHRFQQLAVGLLVQANGAHVLARLADVPSHWESQSDGPLPCHLQEPLMKSAGDVNTCEHCAHVADDSDRRDLPKNHSESREQGHHQACCLEPGAASTDPGNQGEYLLSS